MERNNNQETNKSKWRRVFAVAGGVGLAALLFAGCSEGSTGAAAPGSVESPRVHEPILESQYYENGNRMLHYINEGNLYSDVLQTCDGKDLLEQTQIIAWASGAAGNSIVRSVGHPACADGKLTESDFAAPK